MTIQSTNANTELKQTILLYDIQGTIHYRYYRFSYRNSGYHSPSISKSGSKLNNHAHNSPCRPSSNARANQSLPYSVPEEGFRNSSCLPNIEYSKTKAENFQTFKRQEANMKRIRAKQWCQMLLLQQVGFGTCLVIRKTIKLL